MHIFFCASVYGKTKFNHNYEAIAKAVEANGHALHADHILNTTPEMVAAWDEATNLKFHKKMIDGIKKADAVFADVSYSSTTVGYLIAMAVQSGKPVVVFYTGDSEPQILKGLEGTLDKLQIVRYRSLEEIDKEVPFVLDFAAGSQDVRFNFFVSPSLSHYLDWVSKKKKIPRSVYLRNLIDQDMQRQEFEKVA